jgi:hypothetical protein
VRLIIDQTISQMKFKILIYTFFFIIIYLPVFSAKTDTISHLYTGLQAHYGFIIPHSQSIKDISHTNPYGFEINLNRIHTSFDKWQVFNAYWISGLEARYFNYQNPEVLGGVFDVCVFAEPVVRHGKNFLFTVRGGAGICYHTKVYDEIDNPLNFFFSSRLSFPLFVDARFKYRLGRSAFLTLSGCYNHISNGGVRLPNKGMNFPTFALGLEVHHKPFPILNHEYFSDAKARKPGSSLLFQLLTSVKVLNATGDLPETAAFIYGFHSRISKPLSAFYALNAGAEMIFDGYIKETLVREQRDIDYKRFALTFGQDFMLGKMFFTQYLGAYIYSPYKARNALYQKYELAYKFPSGLMVGVYLKSHLQVAELMGIHINYSLKFGS